MFAEQAGCEYPFQLRSFAGSAGNPAGLTLGGVLKRLPGLLSVEYLLAGEVSQVLWPASVSLGFLRKHELWRRTCFEVFFGIPGEAAYWEVNLCPDGCWNLYHFSTYRKGMQEEVAVERLSCHVKREGRGFHLSCKIDMKGIVPDYRKLEVGIAAVILDVVGAGTYWAIDHLGKMPDFHNRQSFKAVLPAVAEEAGFGQTSMLQG